MGGNFDDLRRMIYMLVGTVTPDLAKARFLSGMDGCRG